MGLDEVDWKRLLQRGRRLRAYRSENATMSSILWDTGENDRGRRRISSSFSSFSYLFWPRCCPSQPSLKAQRKTKRALCNNPQFNPLLKVILWDLQMYQRHVCPAEEVENVLLGRQYIQRDQPISRIAFGSCTTYYPHPEPIWIDVR